MKVKIYKSTYKDQKAVTLESEEIEAQFLPGLGGKLASLVHKKSSREFLAQAANDKYRVLEYDGNYVDSECSGFDDMFPTIDICHYEGFPWAGAKLPDHGEVCSLSWDYAIEDDCLYMCTYGVRLPYKLEKWVRFESDDLLNINYKATNPSSFDMDFIWAAHPMINAEAGGEIILPYKSEQDMTCVFSMDESFGKYGDAMK